MQDMQGIGVWGLVEGKGLVEGRAFVGGGMFG